MPTRVSAMFSNFLFRMYRVICNENKSPVISEPLVRPTTRTRLSSQSNLSNRNGLRPLFLIILISCVLLANRFQFHLQFSTLVNAISSWNLNFSAFVSFALSLFQNNRPHSISYELLKQADHANNFNKNTWNTEIGWSGWLLIALNAWFFFICVFNTFFMESTCFEQVDNKLLKPHLKVTILLAARNEQFNIERCLNSLLAQDYPNYEILVMNDDSTDGTGDLLMKMVKEHPCRDRLRTFTSQHLPSNWYGKAYSIQLLSKHATGDIFVVTDADTLHRSDSISCCVKNLLDNNCDFISGFPHQELTSFGQRVLVPAIYLMSTFLIPMWLMDRTRTSLIALAIGQLKVYRREAFEAVGGYCSISKEVCEDVQMARLLKRSGFKIKFIDAKAFVTCNMYSGYVPAFEGIAKTYFSALDHSVMNFLFAGMFLVIACVPWFQVPIDFFVLGRPIWIVHLICAAMFTCSWTFALYQRQIGWWISFLGPLLLGSLVINAFYAFYIQLLGQGFQWKDRYVK